MTYLKTLHLSSVSIASALLLAACGGGGGGSSSGGTTTTPVADTSAPVLSFTPASLTVESEGTGSSTLRATDNRGITSGPTVSCTNGGSFSVSANTFNAPSVSSDTQSVCTATASDLVGNTGRATLTVTINAAQLDTIPPEAVFDPATLTVASGQSAMATLIVTEDSLGDTSSSVSCTNGGSFNVATDIFTAAADVTENTQSVCTATVTDEAGNVGTATLTVTMTPAAEAVSVTLSGKLTYDRVPVSNSDSSLDYDNIVQMPIRQAPVELLDASGAVLDSTVSDDNGDYSFDVESGQEVRVRVRSEIQKDAPNEIDFKVVDNTSDDALYALQGAVSAVPASNQTRNLNAASGWGGSSYVSTRAAAPFALLDTVFTALEGFIAVDDEVDFPAFNVLWSTRNRSESGSVADGQIGTSSFTVTNGIPVIRILGDEDNDTDEYDVHVVVHEFGHYFENTLSRADSIGGPHSTNDQLDARVAFGEGWGNALSGMILDDPFYRDSFGDEQGRGFFINVENNTYTSSGWYSEGSVQSILYDIFDDADDGADTASFGLGPIYNAFTDPEYSDTEAFTSIFAFLQSLEDQAGVTASAVTALTDAQDINGTTEFGIGETNDGGLSDQLPVYLNLRTDGTAAEFCSFDNFGTFNKHGNRRYLEFTTTLPGAYRFVMTRDSGDASSDPDFLVFRNGTLVGVGESGVNNTETQTITLAAGRHVIDAYSFDNIGGGASADVCYTMTLEVL